MGRPKRGSKKKGKNIRTRPSSIPKSFPQWPKTMVNLLVQMARRNIKSRELTNEGVRISIAEQRVLAHHFFHGVKYLSTGFFGTDLYPVMAKNAFRHMEVNNKDRAKGELIQMIRLDIEQVSHRFRVVETEVGRQMFTNRNKAELLEAEHILLNLITSFGLHLQGIEKQLDNVR